MKNRSHEVWGYFEVGTGFRDYLVFNDLWFLILTIWILMIFFQKEFIRGKSG